MKKYLKEIVVIILQVFAFYLLPQIIGNIGALGMVFLLLLTTFVLSVVIGCISKNKIKYCYSIVVSLLFIPTIWIYYNESAFVHSLWYLIISGLGVLIGTVMSKVSGKCINKKVLIICSIVIIVLIMLWFSGIIPKQIGKIYGINYMKNNFPEMQLEYVGIEWNKYYGDYIISFKDKDNQNYGCVIGPKYLPISIGQGRFAIEETYKEKYSYNELPAYISDGIGVADGNEIEIPEEKIEYNRDVKNVTIKVLEDTITDKSVEILITDNNEDYFVWGINFKVQEKIKGQWKDLECIYLYWDLLAYIPNEDKQIKQKLDIEKYYGILKNGTYRIVKSVDDVDIYSNEFEIK